MLRFCIAALCVVFAWTPVFAAGTAAPGAAPAAAPPAPTARPAPVARPATAPAAKPPAAAKPAVPQLWFVAKTGSGAIAYDGYSIKLDPTLGTVKISSLLYMSTSQTSPEGKPFQYVLASDVIDCIGGRFQPASRYLLAPDGTVVSRNGREGAAWVPLAQNPPLAFLQRIACQGAPLAKSKQATDLANALLTMRVMAAVK